jgi:LysR family transcriptional regulator, transcriptional activator of the cysJI operon
MRFTQKAARQHEAKMKSEYYQTLVTALTLGSFSKAAEKLFVTQSAVSRRIQYLEEQYGYPLIDRSGPVLLPTEVGKIVLDKAHKMLALEKELAQEIYEFEHKQGVTFCCTPAFGMTFLPEIMKKFMPMHANTAELHFSFEFPDRIVEGLKGGTYQAGLIEHIENYDLSGFETFKLPDDEFVFISSPKLGITDDEVLLERLKGYNLYLRKEGSCANKLLSQNLRNNNATCSEFARTITCDDLHLIISTVEEGNGISFVPRSLVRQQLIHGKLNQHHVTGFDHTHHRTLIVNSKNKTNPLLKDFITEIFAAFDQTARI